MQDPAATFPLKNQGSINFKNVNINCLIALLVKAQLSIEILELWLSFYPRPNISENLLLFVIVIY